MVHHVNKFESPLLKDSLCQDMLKLAWWFRREWKCEVYRTILMIGETNFQLRWAKNWFKMMCIELQKITEISLYNKTCAHKSIQQEVSEAPSLAWSAVSCNKYIWTMMVLHTSNDEQSFLLAQWFLRYSYDDFVFNFSLLHYYWASTLTEGHTPALNKLWIFHQRNIFYFILGTCQEYQSKINISIQSTVNNLNQ